MNAPATNDRAGTAELAVFGARVHLGRRFAAADAAQPAQSAGLSWSNRARWPLTCQPQ